ncbi:hypothetical protein ACTXT7_013346 [Hymenolepis weldensis]
MNDIGTTMKHHSRSKKVLNETAAYVIEHSSVDIPNQCPILHQLTESGETELERILAANTQRMTCISRHLRGEPMPEPVLRSLGLMEPDPDNQPQHPLETARLIQAKSEESSSSSFRASTNPDNPLSIIISNKKDQPLEVKTESHNAGQNDKEKATEASKSMPASPIPSPCEIPNRFWALMEPYCADITESNISYLEGILRSYVEEATTSKYFQLPQSKYPRDNDHICMVSYPSEYTQWLTILVKSGWQRDDKIRVSLKRLHAVIQDEYLALSMTRDRTLRLCAGCTWVKVHVCHVRGREIKCSSGVVDGQPHWLIWSKIGLVESSKRLRRDTLTKSEVGANNDDSAEVSTNSSQFSEALKSATEMVTLARRVDTQLKEMKPASSSSVESLLGSLERNLYDDNVSSVLRRAVAHMAQEIVDKTDGSAHTSREDVTENGSDSMVPATSSDLSGVCSQQLKNLARQLQVSSSFRVEKKIGQAIEELGLFPITLYLNHLSHRPDKPLLHFPEKVNAVLPFPFHLGASNHEVSESSPATDSKSSLSNGLDRPAPPKDLPPPASPKSPPRSNRRARSETALEIRPKGPSSAVQSNGCSPPQSDLKNGGGGEVEEGNTDTVANTASSTDPSTTNEEEDTCPADAEIDGSNADTTDEVPSIPPVTLQADYEETSELPNDPNNETLRSHLVENHKSLSTVLKSDESISEGQDKKEGNLSTAACNGDVDVALGEGNEWFVGSVLQLNGTDEDEDFSNCILNLTSSSSKNAAGGSVIEAASGSSDQITLAVMRRQRELRQLCASNHNILHRLVQAARRDLQRQEIQRRLAIADADVLEAYNKLESYKAQKRTALKRDRDFAWKTLKERQKIRAELDAFDKKPPGAEITWSAESGVMRSMPIDVDSQSHWLFLVNKRTGRVRVLIRTAHVKSITDFLNGLGKTQDQILPFCTTVPPICACTSPVEVKQEEADISLWLNLTGKVFERNA